MTNNFEPIYMALFTLLQGLRLSAGVVTCSRVWKHWDDVKPESMPAVYLSEEREIAADDFKLPYKWTLWCDIWVYTYTSVEDETDIAPGAVALNAVLAGIREIVRPTSGCEQTLDGLVHKCRIEGEILKDDGAFIPNSFAKIPVKLLVT